MDAGADLSAGCECRCSRAHVCMARKFRLALFCITIVCSVTVLESCPKQTRFGAAKIDSNPGPFFQVPEWSFSPPQRSRGPTLRILVEIQILQNLNGPPRRSTTHMARKDTRLPSSRQDTPSPIRRQPLPDPNFQIPHSQLPRLLRHSPIPVLHFPDTHHRRRREQQRLSRIKMHDGVEDFLEITLRARRAREVRFQSVEPLRGREAMDKRHGAEVQQFR